MEICLSEATNSEWSEIQVRYQPNLLANNIIPHDVDNGLEIYRNYPQYQWNRSSAALVKTSALVRRGPLPAYTAISHLGRRREAGPAPQHPKRQAAIFLNAVRVMKWPHELIDLSSLVGTIMVRG